MRACRAAFTAGDEQLQCIADARSPGGVTACALGFAAAEKLTCAAGAPSREVVRACGGVFASTADKLDCMKR